MNTNHTPGPWFIQGSPNGYKTVRCDKGGEIARMGSENTLADDSSAAANAHLIAASPDLLAALQQIERLSRDADSRLVNVPAMLGDIARAALAKATQE